MSEEFQPLTGENAEANIDEFIEKHGLEGFLVLYFRQFFFRFVKGELQSADQDIEDLSVQLHLNSEGDPVIQDKRERMRSECEKWARRLVEELKDDEVLEEVISNGDFERLWDDEVEQRWQDLLHDTLEEWKNEAELDHAPPDTQTELPADERDQA